MTVRTTKLGGTDWVDGTVLTAADLNDTYAANDGALGEVKQFALSIIGAVTKAALQTRGWAICDGTTPASQGISSPTIATTPNLEHTFMRMSDDESSGGTGGSETHNHAVSSTFHVDDYPSGDTDAVGTTMTSATSTLPTYYELAFFMKVK